MLTSTTLNPTRFSTLLITLRRTASETCGIGLPYSTAKESSTIASSSPTSTPTPRVGPPPVTLSKNPPTARAVPPPHLDPLHLLGRDPCDLCDHVVRYVRAAVLATKRAAGRLRSSGVCVGVGAYFPIDH